MIASIISFLFIALFAFLGLLPIILFKEGFIRPFQMKKIAKEFGLFYKFSTGFRLRLEKESKKNILKGSINSHTLEIYDLICYYRRSCTRSTIFVIDGKKKEYIGKISGYYPVKKIIERLNELSYGDIE